MLLLSSYWNSYHVMPAWTSLNPHNGCPYSPSSLVPNYEGEMIIVCGDRPGPGNDQWSSKLCKLVADYCRDKKWTSYSNNFSLITELPSFYDRINLACWHFQFYFWFVAQLAMIQPGVLPSLDYGDTRSLSDLVPSKTEFIRVFVCIGDPTIWHCHPRQLTRFCINYSIAPVK